MSAPSITFEPTRMEVARPLNGRPGYVWVDAVYVVVDGVRHYPPMRKREARAYAKTIKGCAL